MGSDLKQAVLDQLRVFSTPERPVYLVGGAVRDLLLGRPVHDLDFVLPGRTRKLANEITCRLGGALYVLDEERDTTRVLLETEQGSRFLLDFASFRGPDLEADLRARDFTVNAMAYDVAHPDHLVDPLGGLVDLREKRIRACSETSIKDDPVRVLRAVRQSLCFQFHIAPETLRLIKTAAPLLPQISAERKRDELFRILDGPQVALAVRILDQVGAMHFILPEMEALKGVEQAAPHQWDVWEHTLNVVQYLEQLLPPLVGAYQEEKVPDLTVGSAVLWLGRFREKFAEHFRTSLMAERSPRALLMMAALYHDIAKPDTRLATDAGSVHFYTHDELGAKQVTHRGRALALSVDEIERLAVIVKYHMRIHHLAHDLSEGEQPSRRAVYRFFKDTQAAGVDVCLLSLADVRGTYGFALPQNLWQIELETCRSILDAYWENHTEIVSPQRYLSGSDLILAFHLTPGRLIGHLLDAIREAQAAGEIGNREEAMQFARDWLTRKHAALDDFNGGEERE